MVVKGVYSSESHWCVTATISKLHAVSMKELFASPSPPLKFNVEVYVTLELMHRGGLIQMYSLLIVTTRSSVSSRTTRDLNAMTAGSFLQIRCNLEVITSSILCEHLQCLQPLLPSTSLTNTIQKCQKPLMPWFVDVMRLIIRSTIIITGIHDSKRCLFRLEL